MYTGIDSSKDDEPQLIAQSNLISFAVKAKLYELFGISIWAKKFDGLDIPDVKAKTITNKISSQKLNRAHHAVILHALVPTN